MPFERADLSLLARASDNAPSLPHLAFRPFVEAKSDGVSPLAQFQQRSSKVAASERLHDYDKSATTRPIPTNGSTSSSGQSRTAVSASTHHVAPTEIRKDAQWSKTLRRDPKFGLPNGLNQPAGVADKGSWSKSSIGTAGSVNPLAVLPRSVYLSTYDDEHDQDRRSCDKCGHAFRSIHDLKKHMARHSRLYHCAEEGCPKSSISFRTINDLHHHEQSVHHKHPGKTRMYRCFAPGCAKASKLWLQVDNFKQHLIRMHPNEDVEALVEKTERWHSEGYHINEESDDRERKPMPCSQDDFMYISYTISEDRCGSQNDFVSTRLVALGDRGRLKDQHVQERLSREV